MFIIWVVVPSWQQLKETVPENDALRWSRAVRTFVKQPDVYFDDGIFFRHWCTPLEYNTPKFDCA
jgi:hypothetical protein